MLNNMTIWKYEMSFLCCTRGEKNEPPPDYNFIGTVLFNIYG